MRKIFTLIAAMFVACAVNAATVQVSPGSGTLTAAITSATAGDILELASGTYTENGDYSINKNITIKAAENAHPVISHLYYFKVDGGAQVTIQGIEFDGSGASDHGIRAHNNSTGAEVLTLDGCTFHNYPSYVIYTQRTARKWHALIVRDCKFYANTKHSIAILNDTGCSCDSVVVENSTFENTTGGYNGILVQDGNITSVAVDHCTFYNFGGNFVKTGASVTPVTISNCIFAQPAAGAIVPLSCGETATINNCLNFNTADLPATATACVSGDPLFTNASAGDFTLGEGSPALTAAADGGAVGDPRWVPAQGLPYMAIIGEWNGWAGNELVPDSAQLTASCTVHLDMNQSSGYGFKVLIGSVAYCIQPGDSWYAFHRDWTTASGIDYVAGSNDAFWLQIDMAGDYGFKWTMAEKKLEITFPEMPTRTVYFVNNMGWETVYAYAWDPQIAAWPGELASLTELLYTYPIYSYTLPINRQNIIFNDGTGGEGHQTADLVINENAPFYFNGAWYASVADLPTNLQSVNDEVKAVKVIKNGQILIQKNDETYNVLGVEVK